MRSSPTSILKSHGFELLTLDPLLFAPSLDGHSLLIPRDFNKAAAEIGRHSKFDADKYPAFCALAKNLSAFLQTLYGIALPDKANPRSFNPAELLKIGWKFHRLGEKEMYEFLRVLPMSVADWLNEWFENDLLKATLAASGILGSFVGPRQQGTAFNLLHHQIGASNGALRTSGFVRGGIGQLSQALAKAAQRFGVEIRTGAEVLKIVTNSGAATGIVLQNGEEIDATQVISSADVKRTFLKLVEPTYLGPHFLLQVQNIRARGTVAKVNLALDALPKFKSANDHDAGCTRRRYSYRSDAGLFGTRRRRREIWAIFSNSRFWKLPFRRSPTHRSRPQANTSCRYGCSRRPTISATAIGTSGATPWATQW